MREGKKLKIERLESRLLWWKMQSLGEKKKKKCEKLCKMALVMLFFQKKTMVWGGDNVDYWGVWACFFWGGLGKKI